MTRAITPSEARNSFAPLRAVCENIAERMTLGVAIKRGWSAQNLLDLAEFLRVCPRGWFSLTEAMREAIVIGATQPPSSLPLKN